MDEPLVVVGAGGFGREVIDVVRAINAAAALSRWHVMGVVDDAPTDKNLTRLEKLNVAYLGNIATLAHMDRHTAIAIAVGSPTARVSIAKRLSLWGYASPELRHPSAVFGSSFKTMEGLIACAQVSVGTNVQVGRHVHLNANAVVGHDTDLADWVSLNPSATISGECRIGPGVLVGAGSVVLAGLTVASASVIGASSCVVRDVPTDVVVKGVPAK